MIKHSVPVKVAAKALGKDPCWVRAGIIAGWLPIGTATRKGQAVTSIDEMDGKKGRINYYISPKKTIRVLRVCVERRKVIRENCRGFNGGDFLVKKLILTITGWALTFVMVIFYIKSRKKWSDYAEHRYTEGYTESDKDWADTVKEMRKQLNETK